MVDIMCDLNVLTHRLMLKETQLTVLQSEFSHLVRQLKDKNTHIELQYTLISSMQSQINGAHTNITLLEEKVSSLEKSRPKRKYPPTVTTIKSKKQHEYICPSLWSRDSNSGDDFHDAENNAEVLTPLRCVDESGGTDSAFRWDFSPEHSFRTYSSKLVDVNNKTDDLSVCSLDCGRVHEEYAVEELDLYAFSLLEENGSSTGCSSDVCEKMDQDTSNQTITPYVGSYTQPCILGAEAELLRLL